jgi:hypothetical protein
MKQDEIAETIGKPGMSRACRRIVLFVSVLILLSPFLYLLSIGPMTSLVDAGYISGRHAEAVYFPLRLAPGPCQRAIRDYIEWWR